MTKKQKEIKRVLSIITGHGTYPIGTGGLLAVKELALAWICAAM
jgi:hypothetical protein